MACVGFNGVVNPSNLENIVILGQKWQGREQLSTQMALCHVVAGQNVILQCENAITQYTNTFRLCKTSSLNKVSSTLHNFCPTVFKKTIRIFSGNIREVLQVNKLSIAYQSLYNHHELHQGVGSANPPPPPPFLCSSKQLYP